MRLAGGIVSLSAGMNRGKGHSDGGSESSHFSHIGKEGAETIFNPINGGDLTIHGGQIFGNVKTKEGAKLGNLTITTPITTDNFEDGSVTGVLENRFDAGEVQRELDLQEAVTKENQGDSYGI